jgi:hypothetical protein
MGQREAVQARALLEKADRLLEKVQPEDRTELERLCTRVRTALTDRHWDKVTAASNELADILFCLEDAWSMRCPVCRAEVEQGPQCRRCRADLSLLFALDRQRRRAQDFAAHCLAQGEVQRELRQARSQQTPPTGRIRWETARAITDRRSGKILASHLPEG